MEWFKGIIEKLFLEEVQTSKGIPLQICDIFLQELNKVDSQDISNTNLSSLLEPFLVALAKCKNVILIQRIKDKIFLPLLENNTTEKLTDNEIEDGGNEKYYDGGKLPPKT